MRIGPAPGSGPPPPARNHLCWGYDTPGEFFARARPFLAEGLAAGFQVWCVAPVARTELAEQLSVVDGFDEAVARGAAQVSSLSQFYPVGSVVDPAEQVATYAAATEAALAAGYRGLRVAADATNLVAHPAQLDSFAHYEPLIDRFMTAHPFQAMCAFDRSALGADAVSRLACLHPRVEGHPAPFRLHTWARGGGQLALSGEVDLSTRELLPWALAHHTPDPASRELVIDATELRYLDHRGLIQLAEHAERHGVTAVLRTGSAGIVEVARLLELRGIRVEQVA